MESRYDAFISYRHKEPDITAAKEIHRLIETYRIPDYIKKKSGKLKMGKVFRDQDELPLMADLGEGIRAALDMSDWLIVVCTPDLPQSKWCLAEVDHFIKTGRRDRILTVLASGEPEQSFPPQLRFLEDEDGNITEKEPLAADIRSKSKAEMLKKLRNEKLRLLAPMLSVGYDDLRRRQRERMMKTVAGVSAAAAVFFAVFGGFSLYQASTISRQNTELEERERELKAERDNLLTIQSRNLAEQSLTQLEYRNVAGATLLALEALPKNPDEPERPLVPEAEMALRSAVMFDGWRYYRPIGSVLLPKAEHGLNLYIAPDTKTFTVTKNSNEIYLYDLKTLKLISSIKDSLASTLLYQTPSGFSIDIYEPIYSVDGSRLLVSTKGGLYEIDTSSGSALKRGPLQSAEEFEGYRSGRYRSSGSTVRDVVDDTEVIRLRSGLVSKYAYSPDGFHYVCTGEGRLLFIDLRSGETLLNIPLTGGWGTGDGYPTISENGYLAVSPDNRYILRGGLRWVDAPGHGSYRSREGCIQLFDSKTGELLYEYSSSIVLGESSLPNSGRAGLLFSPDGRFVLLPLWRENAFRLYDLESRRILYQSRDLEGSISGLSFSSDGDTILAVAGRSVILLNAETGEDMQNISGKFTAGFAEFTQDDRYIIAKGGSGAASILVWERSEEHSSKHIDSLHNNGLFLPDGRILLYGYLKVGLSIETFENLVAESRITLYNSAGDAQLSYPDSELAENAFLSSDGSRVFGTVPGGPNNDSLVTRVWDVETGERLRDYEVDFHAVSSDDKRLLRYDTSDSNIRKEYGIYDADSGDLIFSGSEPDASSKLVFDRMLEKYIFLKKNELLVRSTGGALLLRIEDFPRENGRAVLNPDGSLLAVVVNDGGSLVNKVYDFTSGEWIVTLDSGDGGGFVSGWSPDGSGLLISGGSKNMCWMVNTEDWTTRYKLYNQPDSSFSGSFSSDGSVIYCYNYARDARTGELIIFYGNTVLPDCDYVGSSDDGSRFLFKQFYRVGDFKRYLFRLFDMSSLEELMEEAPTVVRERLFTPEELRFFGLE